MQALRLLLLVGVVFFFSGRVSALNEELKTELGGLFTSFTGNFNYSNSKGAFYGGKIYYQYPNKVHIELATKKVIATNGIYLWIYNPETSVCIRQTVEPGDMGIFSRLDESYDLRREQNRFVFEKLDILGAVEKKVVIDVENSMLKAIQIQENDETVNISFSNVETDIGIKAALFNYKPPTDAQLLENPLNKLAKEF